MTEFQLTTSRRGRHADDVCMDASWIFQLTTSRRGRPRKTPVIADIAHFNSRPHEEVDVAEIESGQYSVISTHDLTKRSTLRLFVLIHNFQYFNSRPHEEVDEKGRREDGWQRNFNSRPHEEVDRRAEKEDSLCDISTHDLTKRSTVIKNRTDVKQCISTHDLTKRSTDPGLRHIVIRGFQLTTSRRGRHTQLLPKRFLTYFNSRPHEEVDDTERGRKWRKRHFNSRPHEEVDDATKTRFSEYGISTHDLTKRSTAKVHKSPHTFAHTFGIFYQNTPLNYTQPCLFHSFFQQNLSKSGANPPQFHVCSTLAPADHPFKKSRYPSRQIPA